MSIQSIKNLEADLKKNKMYMFIMPQLFFFKNVGIFNVAKFLIELMKDIILSCYFGVKKNEGILSGNMIISNFQTNKLEIFL